jgi:hypothetical protein
MERFLSLATQSGANSHFARANAIRPDWLPAPLSYHLTMTF